MSLLGRTKSLGDPPDSLMVHIAKTRCTYGRNVVLEERVRGQIGL